MTSRSSALRTVRPVRPSAALTAAYRAQLERLVDAMTRDVAAAVELAYARHSPRTIEMASDGQYWPVQREGLIAYDETPMAALLREIRRLGRHWLKRWDRGAERLADWFATRASDRSTDQLRRILRDAGISVRFRMTRAMTDVFGATVAENVALIKSIPQQYLGQVEQLVARSVAAGGDQQQLVADLRKRYGITRRRAALIARDQNEKATSAFNRVRQLEAGITQAVWVHSGGGHEPRPTHVKAGRERTVYSVVEGWYDPAIQKYIQPGSEINCRCTSRPVLPALALERRAA